MLQKNIYTKPINKEDGLVNIQLIIGLIIVSLVLLYWGGFWVYTQGANSVRAAWTKAEDAYQAELVLLQSEKNELELLFKQTVSELNEQITTSKKEYEDALERAHDDFTDRLRKSEGRVQTYASMSQAGANERTALADHAAKLDRSLEEGRHLVRELREALGQREREMSYLGSYISEMHSLMDTVGK